MEEARTKIKINEYETERRVVIIGGGFAGVRAALDLLRSKNNFKVILLDKNGFHSFHPDYYEVATAALEEREKPSITQFYSVRSTVAIPFKNIFKGYKNIQVLNDEALNLNPKRQFVETARKKQIFYDWLIVSAGSETNYFNIPRLKELSFELKSVNDALNIRNAIDELFEREGKKKKINIIIGGGGFTGCELAGELANYLKNLVKIHKRPGKNHSIKIVEASPAILGGASKWAQKKAKNRLLKIGVDILTDRPIGKISQNEIFFKAGGGDAPEKSKLEPLNYDILIWTAGVKANKFSTIFDKNILAEKQCLKINKFLQIPLFKNIFAAGDIAFYFDPAKNNPLPMTAQTAISQGSYAAYAINREINKKKLKPYKPKQSRFIIPLGGKYALADFGFIKFSGFFAWILKHLVALLYFLSILPFFSALTLWLRGLKIHIKND